MGVFVRELRATKAIGTMTRTVLLGPETLFVAWGTVTWIDPTIDFDTDNAVAIDILRLNNNVDLPIVWGGGRDLHPGAVSGFGSFVTFRLRAFHNADLECLGYGIVITGI